MRIKMDELPVPPFGLHGTLLLPRAAGPLLLWFILLLGCSYIWSAGDILESIPQAIPVSDADWPV